MPPIRLLIVPGSVRASSLNLRLARCVQQLAPALGMTGSVLDLRALDLPLYDGDWEGQHGVPAGALALRDALAVADAVLWVTPEYNGFPTPLMFNALDWLSRVPASVGQVAGVATTTNKPAALLSASSGPGGGLRAMNLLRQFLQMNFAMLVVPQQFALGRAQEAFDAAGALSDPRAADAVKAVLAATATLATALHAQG